MNTRTLKVEEHYSPRVYGESIYSCIRLKGKWLRDAGFKPNDTVNVVVENNTILIRKESDECKC